MNLTKITGAALTIASAFIVACSPPSGKNSENTTESNNHGPIVESPHSSELIFQETDFTKVHAVPDNFKGAGFLQSDVFDRSLSVAFIRHTETGPLCTGTLIDKDLLLTNSHCVAPSRGEGIEYRVGDDAFQVIFNYQHINGQEPDFFDLTDQRSEFLYEVEEILENGRRAGFQWDNDFAILRLRQNPICVRKNLCPEIPVGNLGRAGDNFGITPLSNIHPEYNQEFTMTIQHPNSLQKYVDMGMWQAGAISGSTLYIGTYDGLYLTNNIDTMNGSSGSGVLGDRGRLIGINTYGFNGDNNLPYDILNEDEQYVANGWNAAVAIERIQNYSPTIRELLNRTLVRGDFTGDGDVDQWDRVVLQAYVNAPTNDWNVLNANAHALDAAMPAGEIAYYIPHPFNANFIGEESIDQMDVDVLGVFIGATGQINNVNALNVEFQNQYPNVLEIVDALPEEAVLLESQYLFRFGDVDEVKGIQQSDGQRIFSCKGAEFLIAIGVEPEVAYSNVNLAGAESCKLVNLFGDVNQVSGVDESDGARIQNCLDAQAAIEQGTPEDQAYINENLTGPESCSKMNMVATAQMIGDLDNHYGIQSSDAQRVFSCSAVEFFLAIGYPAEDAYPSAGLKGAGDCLGSNSRGDVDEQNGVSETDGTRISKCVAAWQEIEQGTPEDQAYANQNLLNSEQCERIGQLVF